MKDNSLNSSLRRLVVSHTFMDAGRLFFEVFMNVYIWKHTESVSLLAWFNIAYLLASCTSFSIFSHVVKRGRMHLPRQLGLIGFAIVYFSIFLLGDNTIDYSILIAVFMGFANGMYWISYQLLRYDLNHNLNRGNYSGLERALGLLVDTVMPTLGGYLIAADVFGLGYSVLFLAGTAFFIASFFSGNISYPKKPAPSLHLAKTWKMIRKNKAVMNSMWSYFFASFSRDGALVRFLLPILIYDILKSEYKLGWLLSLFAVVAMISSAAFGKYIRYGNYRLWLSIGSWTFAALVLALLIHPTFMVIILFGISANFIKTFILIPRRVMSENLIGTLKDPDHHRVEYIVIREWFNTAFGRAGSYLILLFVAGIGIGQLKYALIAIAAASLLELYLLLSLPKDLAGA